VDEARLVLERRLVELDEEREQVTRALDALGSDTTSGSAGPRRAPARTRDHHTGGGKRAARGQRQEEFLAELSTNPGASMTDIARRIGVSPQQLYPIAHRLEASGAIVKTDDGYQPTKSADGTATAG
jgi:hypothetical protein